MKKYNLSNIMKRAWELVRKLRFDISKALKRAWAEAKVLLRKEETIEETIERVYNEYKTRKETIERGWISEENISFVTLKLNLRNLSNKELSDMWFAIDKYFEKIMAEYDENGKVIAWKPYTEEIAFAMDTDSAWKEVCNVEARRRKSLGLM